MKWLVQNKKNYSGIKFSSLQLLAISTIAIIIILLIQLTEIRVPKSRSKDMLTAATKMREAEHILSSFRRLNNLEINAQNDPLQSGFIGVEFSPITTTLGDLKAKQTSTNPDFAALFLHWFDELGLEKGNKIIIHTSGSFPALGVAAIIASETFGLHPIIISSVGASSFGANIPKLTYWDIENLLFHKKAIHHKTIYSTPGGQDDNGSSFWEDGLELTKQTAERNSLQINIPKNLLEAIDWKMNFINSQKPFSLFINIGGNQSALGTIPCSMELTHGLITELIKSNNTNCFGLVHKINQMGIPIIHMLNIRNLALENGIDLLPNYNKKLGKTDLYFSHKKSKLLISLSIMFLFFVIGTIIKLNSKKEKGKRKKEKTNNFID